MKAELDAERRRFAESQARELALLDLAAKAVARNADEAEESDADPYARWAKVSHTDPGTLQFKVPAEIGLALVPTTSNIDPATLLDPDRFTGEVQVLAEPVEYALAMRAKLQGSETDFQITPSDWEIVSLPDGDDPMTWTWNVTPLRPGEGKILTILFGGVLLRDGKYEAFPPESQTITLSVDITTWERAVFNAGEVKAVQV